MGKMKSRRQNFQNVAWFWDINKRELLDLDPPYQRRSVWSQNYREEFINTILLDYPAPAIFLFPSVSRDGETRYQLVDGKQRLTAVFDFVTGVFPVSDGSPVKSLKGKYFKDFTKEESIRFWEYDFPVEYLPTNDDNIINNIFDRLNRNVARLTPQELRHAKLDGDFIRCAESLADLMDSDFEANFPRIAVASRRQMKDVEFVATLLLLLEEGPRSYSVDSLDKAFNDRDEAWDRKEIIEAEFRDTLRFINEMKSCPQGEPLAQSRMRNQADYYSLFGAVGSLRRRNLLPPPALAASRLCDFVSLVDQEQVRAQTAHAQAYFDAARSASNDSGPRTARIQILEHVLQGL